MKNLILLFSYLLLSAVSFSQSVNEFVSNGNKYYRQGQFEMAEDQYRQALKKDPAHVIAQQNLANTLYRQKKAKEAIEGFSAVSSQAADEKLRSPAFYNAGVVYSSQKDLESSIEAYKNALRLKPDDQQARENLQKALLELKQKQQQQQKEQQKQPQSSSLSQKEAEKKLDQLEEKEKKIQERIQNQKGGTPQPNDW
jgi:Ca-activated chloride channel family protein